MVLNDRDTFTEERGKWSLLMTMPKKERITFNFTKSALFRVIHANGAFGGVSPAGEISISFYSERFAIPVQITHEIEGNQIGKEVSRKGGTAIERELECQVMMDVNTAVIVRDWLTDKIKEGQKALAVVEASRNASRR